MKLEEVLQLNSTQIRKLEKEILKRIEEIIFNRKRPSGRQKIQGYKTKTVNKKVERTPIYKSSTKIEDAGGKGSEGLRKTLKANKGFMRIENKLIVFDIKMVSYYKYLDDERRDELNWYLTEAIFEDAELKKFIADITAEGIKSKFINIFSQELKQIKP
jgi:hypothetical protein